MNDHELHDLADAYAVDALSPDERAAFEAHLGGCADCAATVAEHRETAARLGGLTATTPPAGLRDSIMDEIASTPQLPPVAQPASLDVARDRRRRRMTIGLGAAAAVVAVAIVGIVVQTGGSSEIDTVLSAPDIVITTLESESGDELDIAWSAARDEAAVIGDGFDPLPEGRTYQLWFLLDEGVSSGGIFRPDDDGEIATVLDVDDLTATGWAVTIEPPGGSPQPTSDIVFSGFIT